MLMDTKKDKKRKNAAAAPGEGSGAGRKRRILIGLLTVALLLAGGAGAAVWFHRVWFTQNSRFLLRRLELPNPGYWRDNPEELRKILCLEFGKHNLYMLNLGDVRRALEKVPNIRYCEVVRILPDTLRIRLTERIPRAILNSPLSGCVIDEDCMVMSRRQSMKSGGAPPIIVGVRPDEMVPGRMVPRLAPVLEILMHCLRNQPDFAPLWFSAVRRDRIEMLVRFQSRARFRAVFPAQSGHYRYLLTTLRQAILDYEAAGKKPKGFDLRFEGSVIVQ